MTRVAYGRGDGPDEGASGGAPEGFDAGAIEEGGEGCPDGWQPPEWDGGVD